MKTITTFSDIEYVINNKLDIKNPEGRNVQFVNLLGMTLIDIVKIINTRNWKYQTEE